MRKGGGLPYTAQRALKRATKSKLHTLDENILYKIIEYLSKCTCSSLFASFTLVDIPALVELSQTCSRFNELCKKDRVWSVVADRAMKDEKYEKTGVRGE